MIRRLMTTAVLVACTAAYVAGATERATFILTTGERKSGPVVFHGSHNENLIDGYLNLGVPSGKEMTFPIEQVAAIDFVGGRPDNAELEQVGTGQAMALRNGTVEQGHFVNILNGTTVRWQDENGSTRNIPISQVSRIYLNPQSAMTAYGYNGDRMGMGNRAGRRGRMAAGPEPGAVRVAGNQPWTSTGIVVKRGDRVAFRTTGQVRYAVGADQTAGPDGNGAIRNPAFPDSAMPVGGLVAKVGNSAPFSIGSNSQPITMPADGVLMLGINDTDFHDNSGGFSVVVTKY